MDVGSHIDNLLLLVGKKEYYIHELQISLARLQRENGELRARIAEKFPVKPEPPSSSEGEVEHHPV